jgi:PDZ domain-containing protein
MPGDPDEVSGELIKISNAQTYPVNGKLYITSILVTNPDAPVFGAETIYNWMRGPNVVLPRNSIYPKNVSPAQVESESEGEMRSSQSTATAAALKYLGYEVDEIYIVSSIRGYSKAVEKLKERDQILSIDGKNIKSIEEIRSSYANKKVGDSVSIIIEREDDEGNSKKYTFTIELVASQEPSAMQTPGEKPAIGILVGTAGKFPVDINFNIDDVGGPSAGMIFAIGIVEKMTEEDLLRGRKIAGTGTISPDGKVGGIGGIEEKLIGASRKGVTLFLAPKENCPDITRVPKGMKVIPVTTLSEAISVLRAPENSKFPTC